MSAVPPRPSPASITRFTNAAEKSLRNSGGGYEVERGGRGEDLPDGRGDRVRMPAPREQRAHPLPRRRDRARHLEAEDPWTHRAGGGIAAGDLREVGAFRPEAATRISTSPAAGDRWLGLDDFGEVVP